MSNTKYAEHIHVLEREMETRKIFLAAAVDEATELKTKEEIGLATDKDQKRAGELKEIAEAHVKWINEHAKEIRNYYKPATVIAG